MKTRTEHALDALFSALSDIHREVYIERADELTTEELREARVYTRGMAAAEAAIRDAIENPERTEYAA